MTNHSFKVGDMVTPVENHKSLKKGDTYTVKYAKCGMIGIDSNSGQWFNHRFKLAEIDWRKEI